MDFRTEFSYEPHSLKMDYSSRIFTIGSCFATEISAKLSERKFSVLSNPFGVLFHPIAIENALMRIYSQEEYQASEIYKNEELFISWDHHSSFSNTSLEKMLFHINQNLKEAHSFLHEADMVIITLGTAFVYRLRQFDLVVANCHKIPNSQFYKQLLQEHQVKTSLKNIIEMLTDIGKKGMKIVFTLSPVRHVKDGIVENNLSKARLLCGIHSAIDSYSANCEYFPVYEFVMDDLRDYRFYKEDLVHPNDLAINYIWEKFQSAYINPKARLLMHKVEKINQALSHKAQHVNTIAYKKFLYSIVKDIQEVEPQLPQGCFRDEFLEVRKRMQESY